MIFTDRFFSIARYSADSVIERYRFMTVIKRNRDSTRTDLLKALDSFIPLLSEQDDEEEAVNVLKEARKTLESATPGSSVIKEVAGTVVEAFEGDLELIAYTFTREGHEWSEAEQLSLASSRVLSLARRLR